MAYNRLIALSLLVKNRYKYTNNVPYAITPDFSGVPDACACNVYQAPFPPPLKKGLGYEATHNVTVCIGRHFFFSGPSLHIDVLELYDIGLYCSREQSVTQQPAAS